MAYQYNIPLATDQLSKSQSDIQGNFNALGVIAGNGATASSSLNGTVGFNYVYFASQAGTIPPITFPANNVGLYSANYPTTGTPANDLYINKTLGGASGTVVQIPSTASILSSTYVLGNASNGWTFYPSGLLELWVTDSTSVTSRNTLFTINYPSPAAFPGFKEVYGVMAIQTFTSDPSANLGNLNTTIITGQVTATNFKIFARAVGSPGGTPAVSIFYRVIGRGV